MSNFQEVCLLSCENWVDTFPDDIPKHKFSKKHKEKMKEIFELDTEIQKHKLSKKTIKILLIAAILLGLATTAFAIPASREFIIQKFSNHSEYNVVDTENAEKVESLKLNYIPEGFVKTEEYNSENYFISVYNNLDKYFSVKKYTIDTNVNYDTEKSNYEIIKVNGIDAVFYKSDNNLDGIIFNNSKYLFVVNGNINKEELVKIAQNVEW